jgi:hypothetical protein
MEATTIPQATPESVWAAIRALTERQAETERIIAERQAKLDRQIEKVNETLGAWANNQGCFSEDYFINAFEKGKTNFFGERFDDLRQRVTGLKVQDEYDILLVNGKSIGIVEVKYKAHENDVDKVLKKAETFRINYPDYVNHQIYLGLASLSFYPELEQECIRNGIAIIKQVGDMVVINDEHLKVF